MGVYFWHFKPRYTQLLYISDSCNFWKLINCSMKQTFTKYINKNNMCWKRNFKDLEGCHFLCFSSSFPHHCPPFIIWLSLILFSVPVVKVLKMWRWLSLLVTFSANNDICLPYIFSCDNSSVFLPLLFSLSVLLSGVRNSMTGYLSLNWWWMKMNIKVRLKSIPCEVPGTAEDGALVCINVGRCTDGKMKTGSAGAMKGSPWCDGRTLEMAWHYDLPLSFASPAMFGCRLKRRGSAKLPE